MQEGCRHGDWTSKSRAQSSIARREQKEENEPKMAVFKLQSLSPVTPPTRPHLCSLSRQHPNWRVSIQMPAAEATAFRLPHLIGNTSDFCCHKVNRFLLTLLLCCSVQEKIVSFLPHHPMLPPTFFLLPQPHSQS